MTTLELPAATRERADRLARWLGVALLALFALILGERFSALAIEVASQGLDEHQRRALFGAILDALPELLQLGALVFVHRWLRGVAEGEWSSAATAQTLRRAGRILVAGAAFALIGVPLAAWALGIGRGYLVAYDPAQVVLAGVGLALTLLGTVLDHGRALAAELEGFF